MKIIREAIGFILLLAVLWGLLAVVEVSMPPKQGTQNERQN
jgi:hypothetical protein